MSTQTAEQAYLNLSSEALIKMALARHEGVLAKNGALTVKTGARTGRSPKDRFIVCDENTQAQIAWGNTNQAISAEKFSQLWSKVENYLQNKTRFVAHLRVGADTQHTLGVKVINELAWHQLFTRNLFIRESLEQTQWTLMSAPNFKASPAHDGTNSDAAVMLNFTEKKILICGTHYAGEMKKAMFTVLNYLLPEKQILPMHCSANVGAQGDVALFFGLSGTGKTTLSADPERFLIGDDEHGWSDNGIFNFEGGCYAKCIDLLADKEPVIWQAIKHGAVMENVVLDEQAQPIFSDASHTQNTRVAYPLTHIEKRILKNQAGQPKAVIFLTCDLHGVLPPVSVLSKAQAAYHFLSGYTALVGSTEVGQTDPIKQTFSTCFGAPFFPRPAAVYADLLMQRIEKSGANVYLVNTGWTGGAYGEGGERFSIPTTRAIIRAILNNAIDHQALECLPGFNLHIPKSIDGVDSALLNPKNTWQDAKAFDTKLKQLIQSFQQNFAQFDVSAAVKAAEPTIEEVYHEK
ncbi:MAG: phosphoenolpyruvate carboxykinase (ATP) [Legionellales bacterium]|nr:phosphoenolpyruvate carboxykinase (ATP) [Legionellales bacterium]